MNKLLVLGGAILAVLGGTLVLSIIVGTLEKAPQGCTPVQILAVGGCDSDGLCGVVAVTQQGEIIEGKKPYPVQGVISCRETIHE